MLPGSHVLLYATAPKNGGDADAWVVALDMDRGVAHRLTPGFQPYYSSNGYLTYALADGSLMARRFDPKTFALSGSPIRLSDRTLTHNYSEAEYAVANDGTMVIRALGAQQSQLRLYSMQGQLVRTIPGNVARHSPRFSPDGHRIAYTQGDYNRAGTYEDVWVYDLTSGVDTRLSDAGNALDPIWSADGRNVRWLDDRNGVRRLMSRPADQSAPAAPFGDTTFAGVQRHNVGQSVRLGFPSDRGALIPLSVDGPDGKSTDIWVMNADGTHAHPFLQTSAHAKFPAVSPSGKWLAYESDETGRSEIYVEPFPTGGPRYRVTTAGGYYPVWATDTTLIYENENYEAVIASVRFANGDVRAGAPRAIVGSVFDQIVSSRSVDVSPDGKTLAVNRHARGIPPAGGDESSAAPRGRRPAALGVTGLAVGPAVAPSSTSPCRVPKSLRPPSPTATVSSESSARAGWPRSTSPRTSSTTARSRSRSCTRAGGRLGAERFLSEIKTTANLHHPHILPLHDSGEADGLLYYVMPFVEGSLCAPARPREPLPLDDALGIAREVADALDYAHRQGVIHRDIKPENILLHDGQALVADFGIALAVQSAAASRMTQTGPLVGTPQYMSPEQAMGEKRSTPGATCTRWAACSTRCSPAIRRSPAPRCRRSSPR